MVVLKSRLLLPPLLPALNPSLSIARGRLLGLLVPTTQHVLKEISRVVAEIGLAGRSTTSPEDELPVGAKGWKVVGARFRDWSATAGYLARADRSLELKFKQVGETYYPHPLVLMVPFLARKNLETNWQRSLSPRGGARP